MDVFLHKLVYEGIKRSEWKNFLRGGEDMKKFGKKIAGFLLAAVLAVTAAFPAFAASKTAVGKIYLTIDSTVGLKNDSEDVTVTPYGDNTDLYYVDNIYIENNDGNGYTESNPPKITVTLEVADEDNYYFSGTASKDFRLTLSDSAKNGYGKAEYVKAVKKNDRSTVELTFRLTFDKKTTASTTSTVKAPTGVAWSPNAYGTGTWSAVSGAKYYQLRLLKDGSLTGDEFTIYGTMYDFSRLMGTSGSYSFEVRSVKSTNNTKSAWVRSGEIGSYAAGSWKQSADGRWWWDYGDGTWAAAEWLYISGKWYYFREDGYMATGWITLYNKSYYLDPVSGAMYKSGRTPDGLYVNESGVYVPGM